METESKYLHGEYYRVQESPDRSWDIAQYWEGFGKSGFYMCGNKFLKFAEEFHVINPAAIIDDPEEQIQHDTKMLSEFLSELWAMRKIPYFNDEERKDLAEIFVESDSYRAEL